MGTINKIWLLIFTCLCCELTYSQKPLAGRDTTLQGPQSFAIVVGISKYQYIKPLAFADKDAELFRDWLQSPAGGNLKEKNIFCLLNKDANNANFWGKGFQWLRAKDLRKGDKLFIYLAGHGDAIDEDQYFFLGSDCKPDGDKNNYLVSGAIQLFNLKKKIANETAKGVEVIFIMDACRSNELPGGNPGQNFLNTAISQKRAGEIMMLATAAGQVSLEDESIGNGHGLFTWYLVDGLTGMADINNADKKISFGEIQEYVENNVPSLALERFKRTQQPYFCCNEFNDRVISTVDPTYLKKWSELKKKLEKKSGKNAITENNYPDISEAADTILVETYNRFNTALKANRLTGTASAEDYFNQLNKKFPNNPYTLDAASSLAVQFANIAQDRVNKYLGCEGIQSSREKQANFEAAVNLEKAYAILREIDEDFANSLLNRLRLLKASGDFGPGGVNGPIEVAFHEAYLGLALEPKGAYIHNRIAQLHLEAGNKDSAMLYAKQSVALAPNWNCALLTLSQIQNSPTISNPADQRPGSSNFKYGFSLGIGINNSKPVFRENPNSVLAVDSKTSIRLGLGFVGYFQLSPLIAIRPSIELQFESTDIEFQRRNQAGGPIFTEIIKVESVQANLSPVFMLRLKKNLSSPYVVAGPSASVTVENNQNAIPIKTFSAALDAGIGYDIAWKRARVSFSPEIKYSFGLTDLRNGGTSIYATSLSSLKKNMVMLNFYLRIL